MPTSQWFRKCCWLAVLSVSLIGSTILFAQSTGGRILGRVSDSSGAVLAGVTVTATNEATGVTRTATTNDSGDYVLVSVQPATYTMQYELAGFKKNVQKGILVDVNQVVTLNSTLQIGGASTQANSIPKTAESNAATPAEPRVTRYDAKTRGAVTVCKNPMKPCRDACRRMAARGINTIAVR